MEPKQNADLKGQSHVYVQKPNGEEINIPASKPEPTGTDEKADQTAENTPTTHSHEVTSGEDA